MSQQTENKQDLLISEIQGILRDATGEWINFELKDLPKVLDELFFTLNLDNGAVHYVGSGMDVRVKIDFGKLHRKYSFNAESRNGRNERRNERQRPYIEDMIRNDGRNQITGADLVRNNGNGGRVTIDLTSNTRKNAVNLIEDESGDIKEIEKKKEKKEK